MTDETIAPNTDGWLADLELWLVLSTRGVQRR
jgi:hypothetical protein